MEDAHLKTTLLLYTVLSDTSKALLHPPNLPTQPHHPSYVPVSLTQPGPRSHPWRPNLRRMVVAEGLPSKQPRQCQPSKCYQARHSCLHNIICPAGGENSQPASISHLQPRLGSEHSSNGCLTLTGSISMALMCHCNNTICHRPSMSPPTSYFYLLQPVHPCPGLATV